MSNLKPLRGMKKLAMFFKRTKKKFKKKEVFKGCTYQKLEKKI